MNPTYISKLLEIPEFVVLFPSLFTPTVEQILPKNDIAFSENYTSIEVTGAINIFINGYRYTHELFLHQREILHTNNPIFIRDVFDYWGKIDDLFIERLGTKNNYYTDAHFSLSTSNHQNISELINSLMSYFSYLKKDKKTESKIIFNKTPNHEGFALRVEEGKRGALNFIKKIQHQLLNIPSKSLSINLIAHSMGYAYALGMIEILKQNKAFELNQFFIIAAENASAKKIHINDFKKIWQYGSDEKGNPLELDGLAPQSSVFENKKVFKNYGRIFIPDIISNKGFFNAHFIKNYEWIFTHLKAGEKGFVGL